MTDCRTCNGYLPMLAELAGWGEMRAVDTLLTALVTHRLGGHGEAERKRFLPRLSQALMGEYDSRD